MVSVHSLDIKCNDVHATRGQLQCVSAVVCVNAFEKKWVEKEIVIFDFSLRITTYFP